MCENKTTYLLKNEWVKDEIKRGKKIFRQMKRETPHPSTYGMKRKF